MSIITGWPVAWSNAPKTASPFINDTYHNDTFTVRSTLTDGFFLNILLSLVPAAIHEYSSYIEVLMNK